MTCSICNAAAPPYCRAKILGKYDVQYYRCSQCQFLFTESPYWLAEAYDSAITRLDIGLVYRNEMLNPIVQTIIKKWFDPKGRFIDYGGGYGMLVRMMRDRGFDFYRQDLHCANLFAESFDITDVPPFKAGLLTSFEVFEHLVDPVAEVEKMLSLSDAILFSTNVQPTPDVSPESWWYMTPETGQHISLYSHASLQALADRFKLNYCWNKENIHLFSKVKISDRAFKTFTHPRVYPWYNKFTAKRPTLIMDDFGLVKEKLDTSLKNK